MIPQYRSLLYIPGDDPAMLVNGGIYEADAVILDLDKTIDQTEKEAARFLVSEALACLDFSPSSVLVRINPLGAGGEDDLHLVVSKGPAAILLSNTQTADDVVRACRLIARYEVSPNTVRLVPVIESPRGVLEGMAIATSDPRVAGLVFGADNYAANLGVTRTKEGAEIAFARAMVVNGASAACVPAYDTSFSGISDPEALCRDVQLAKAMGFKGKLCTHPMQVETMNQVFGPVRSELQKEGRS